MSKKWEDEAAFFQAHKDDPEIGDEPTEAPIVAPKNGLAISITVRFSPREAEAIRETARRERKTYSQVVRAAIEHYTHPEPLQLSRGGNTLAMHPVETTKTSYRGEYTINQATKTMTMSSATQGIVSN